MSDQIPNEPVVPAVPETAPVEAPKVSRDLKNLPNGPAEKLGVLGEEAHGAVTGKFQKLRNNLKAKWNVHAIDEAGNVTKSGVLGKGMRLGGAAAGLVMSGYGAKDALQVVGLVGPDVDEKGKEIPVDAGKLFKAAAEATAGLGLLYFSLLKGGKGLASGAAGMAK